MTNEGFYYLVGDREPSRYGYVWRIWSSATSFYVKPRPSELGVFKVSLHGPDPRHATPGFKIAADGSPSAVATGPGEPFLPSWFEGFDCGNGLTQVLRIAVPAFTLSAGAPLGFPPGEVGKGMRGLLSPAPKEGDYACLDLYVSRDRPVFPEREELQSLNAIAGELQNESGEWLLGISRHLSSEQYPLPHSLEDLDTMPDETEQLRGIAGAMDKRGFVVLCERIMSALRYRAAVSGSDAQSE